MLVEVLAILLASLPALAPAIALVALPITDLSLARLIVSSVRPDAVAAASDAPRSTNRASAAPPL